MGRNSVGQKSYNDIFIEAAVSWRSTPIHSRTLWPICQPWKHGRNHRLFLHGKTRRDSFVRARLAKIGSISRTFLWGESRRKRIFQCSVWVFVVQRHVVFGIHRWRGIENNFRQRKGEIYVEINRKDLGRDFCLSHKTWRRRKSFGLRGVGWFGCCLLIEYFRLKL